jgi:hypothetical protein
MKTPAKSSFGGGGLDEWASKKSSQCGKQHMCQPNENKWLGNQRMHKQIRDAVAGTNAG